jgi:hypothetical protein
MSSRRNDVIVSAQDKAVFISPSIPTNPSNPLSFPLFAIVQLFVLYIVPVLGTLQ